MISSFICWCFFALAFFVERAKFQLSYVFNVELFSDEVSNALRWILYNLFSILDGSGYFMAFEPTPLGVRISHHSDTAFLDFYHYKIFRTTLLLLFYLGIIYCTLKI